MNVVSLRGFGAELASAAVTPRFWAIVARNAIAPVGVFAFGWPAAHVAFYFLFESWLFLSLRAAIETTIDPKFGGRRGYPTSRSFQLALFKQLLACGVLMAAVIGALGVFAVAPAFPDDEWEALLAGGYRDPSFLVAMAALGASVILDTVQFARRHAGRTPAQVRADDDRIQTMIYRVFALAGASFALGFASRYELGGEVLVLVIMVVLVWFEALPRHALAVFDNRRKAR